MASFLRAFCNQIGGYPVSLSSIGALQQICEAFSSSNVAKTHKTSFCDVFLAQNLFLFDLEWSILLFVHLLQYNSRLFCKFELNRSNTAGLRSVFLKYCRKNPKKHVFATLFGPKLTFFQAKWSILLFAHLLQSNRRLPCKFRLDRSITAILRSVFLK